MPRNTVRFAIATFVLIFSGLTSLALLRPSPPVANAPIELQPKPDFVETFRGNQIRLKCDDDELRRIYGSVENAVLTEGMRFLRARPQFKTVTLSAPVYGMPAVFVVSRDTVGSDGHYLARWPLYFDVPEDKWE